MPQIEKVIQKLKTNPTDIQYTLLKKILEKYGYTLKGSKGSHRRFKKERFPSLTIPTHNNKVKKWYVKDIIKILEI